MSKVNSVMDVILTQAEVSRLINLSLSSIRRLRIEGEFPAHIRISPAKVAYYSSSISNWLASRKPVYPEGHPEHVPDGP